jgi:6-phosphofructokinase 1
MELRLHHDESAIRHRGIHLPDFRCARRHTVRKMPTSISNLGECKFQSPLHNIGDVEVRYRRDSERVLYDHVLDADSPPVDVLSQRVLSFEAAGREKIFFDPVKTTAGIVTCGGLSPGLNDIIKNLVTQLSRYGVQRIYGFKYGYQGLVQELGHVPVTLKPEGVSQIHLQGGSVLGSSRGSQDIAKMVDTLEEMNVDILFVVGGDGTLRGAQLIANEIRERRLNKAIIGIPKTIDNDIHYIDKSFGFETAFAEAVRAIRCGQAEALGAPNGVGLVRLMGRDSGFIACHATLADGNVDFVLIPEVRFKLEGERGFLEALRYKIARKRSAVVVVAEGAGQDLMEGYREKDASGNVRLPDIGIFLRDKIAGFFKERRTELNLKYIDPSYLIRAVPANAQDNVLCQYLAQHAVHAGMAGKTAVMVGRWHCSYVHVPIKLVVGMPRSVVNPHGELWRAVLEITGQPAKLM